MVVTEDFKLSNSLFRESPNSSKRPDGVEPSLLVVHCISLPEGNYGTPHVDRLFLNVLDLHAHPTFTSLNGVRVSSHLFIGRTGQIIQYVPFDRQAWHAGESTFNGRSRCNEYSIGVELEGTVDSPFESIQYDKLCEVTVSLMKRFQGIALSRIVGHQEIAPSRKSDPGTYFDWRSYLTDVSNYFIQSGTGYGS